MTLKQLAILYQQYFIDCKYIITSETHNLAIDGQADNFLHLLGIEKYLPSNTTKEQFYYDCLNDKYKTFQSISSKMKTEDKNMANIKSCYFYNLQNSILQADTLFYKDDVEFGVCTQFQYKTKTKYQTVLFKYDKFLGFCVPKSNQTDMAEKYSNVFKYKYNSEPIIKVEIVKQ